MKVQSAVGAYVEKIQAAANRPKPFVKWAGGKRQLLDELRSRLPARFNHYYEPFVGGGALLFEIQPKTAVINDINAALIHTYKEIQSGAEALMFEIDAVDFVGEGDPKAHYYKMRALYNEALAAQRHDVKTAALFIYLNKHCFNGLYRVNAKGFFNVPFNNNTAASYARENLLAVERALQGVSILNGDFERACSGAKQDDLVFFDSPYAPLNATSFESYTKEGFSVEEHVRLSKLFNELTDRGCSCILTNHNTELIKELYQDYSIEVVQVRRAINSDASNRIGTEVIIRNYE